MCFLNIANVNTIQIGKAVKQVIVITINTDMKIQQPIHNTGAVTQTYFFLHRSRFFFIEYKLLHSYVDRVLDKGD